MKPLPAIKFLLITIASLAALLFRVASAQIPGSNSTAVDFHFSPPEWQTAICLPDDPYKSLVHKTGELLYHYGQGKREFATRVGVQVVTNAVWFSQELLSPRVPIVQTKYAAAGLEITQEAFALTAPTQTNSAVAGRDDLILVYIKNTGSEARGLRPQVIVDTTLPFDFQTHTGWARVNNHDTVTASLQMAGDANEQGPRHAIQLAELIVPAGEEIRFLVRYSGGASMVTEPCTVEQALAARQSSIEYWAKTRLPYDRIEVPDPGIQALVDSSIRNIWQAREIKKGLPAFQVGPTCYRGLWIVDGAFLLESAAMLGAGQEARSGVAYELTYQQPDGRIQVMENYSKENGIVLWTCVRHAQLTQDKAWLEIIWPKLERIANHIKTLRLQTLTNASLRDDGLVPAGFPDGGISGVIDEYTNPYWNLAGLHSFVQAAQWLGKRDTVAIWEKEYKDFMKAFQRAARRDLKTDLQGHAYLPIRMDGQDLPQRGQWGFCHAVYPGQIFPRNDPLVTGTLQMMEGTEREGMVCGTGWDPTGIWNYFASFYAHAWLWQGNGRKAAQVLVAYANHAAPTLVWREEQSLLGQPFKKVGDMPHNWASAEFIRLVIHLLALDRGNELHLLEGLPPGWTRPGMVTRLHAVATPFGPLNMSLQIDRDGRTATLAVKPLVTNCKAIIVHLPQGKTRRISPGRGGNLTFTVEPRT